MIPVSNWGSLLKMGLPVFKWDFQIKKKIYIYIQQEKATVNSQKNLIPDFKL